MQMSELRHPTLGTVMGAAALVLALAALIVALSSSADAARHAFVKKGDIAPGAVTAKTLAHGAVHPKALAKGAVTAPKIKAGAVDTAALAKGAVTANVLARSSVTAPALAEDSVTSTALAPKSIYAAAFGDETVHTATIKDQDEIAENPIWTASSTGVAICGTGELLMQTGFTFTNLGNRQVSFLEALPVLNSSTNGLKGAFSSNSGGTAEAQIVAHCLP
jgi:hypothetical protein